MSKLTQQGRQAKTPKAEAGGATAGVQGVVAQLKRQLDAHADAVKVTPSCTLT